jgi:hypothetical protein
MALIELLEWEFDRAKSTMALVNLAMLKTAAQDRSSYGIIVIVQYYVVNG